ncbi:hypothetical protein [Luteolibacter sp. AS25]|uniref:hypothetical protein n=1 Tax=Luteolibacter sp. AS25 TaxID=3135776 RepID=UPI00398B2733
MKTLIILCIGALMAPVAYSQTNLEKAEAYYKQGLTAESAGNADKALASYKAAVLLNPQHANARYRLEQTKINKSAITATGTKARINSVTIPSFVVEDASLSESIELLGVLIEKQTAGKIAPNFIIEDPQGKLSNKTVNLEVKNVPVGALLNFIHGQTDSKARYDPHAVVIRPL